MNRFEKSEEKHKKLFGEGVYGEQATDPPLHPALNA